MKIVVVLNKYGEQENIDVTGVFNKEEEVLSFYNEPTQEFINYYEDVMDKCIQSNLYFDHIFFIDTDNLTRKKYSENYFKSDPLNKFKMYGYVQQV